jgi:hypothetical protein
VWPPSRRSALIFAAKFVALFAVLVIPWRWVGTAYSLGFSLVSTVAMETVVDEREFKVRFEPVDSDGDRPAEAWSVRFRGTNVQTGGTTTVPIEAREIGYVPFATFVSLAFALAVDWRRRRRILALGLVVLGARVALAVGLPVAHFVGALGSGGVFDTAARVAFAALIEPPDMMYAAPVVTFLLALVLTNAWRPADDTQSTGAPSPLPVPSTTR